MASFRAVISLCVLAFVLLAGQSVAQVTITTQVGALSGFYDKTLTGTSVAADSFQFTCDQQNECSLTYVGNGASTVPVAYLFPVATGGYQYVDAKTRASQSCSFASNTFTCPGFRLAQVTTPSFTISGASIFDTAVGGVGVSNAGNTPSPLQGTWRRTEGTSVSVHTVTCTQASVCSITSTGASTASGTLNPTSLTTYSVTLGTVSETWTLTNINSMTVSRGGQNVATLTRQSS